jgi:hypothetical protein
MAKKTSLIILAVGLLIIGFTSFNFITREKIVDLGSVEITQKRSFQSSWSPLLGGVLIIVGGGIYLIERSKN